MDDVVDIQKSECEICEDGCYRASLHSVSPLAVLLDRMAWPHTHGRIELSDKGGGHPWIAVLENRNSPRTAGDTSWWFEGNTRSEALSKAVATCLEEEVSFKGVNSDPLASLLDSLPSRSPWNRIVLRRDQLHIYVYIGRHFGGHGLAEALYNMISITKEATNAD